MSEAAARDTIKIVHVCTSVAEIMIATKNLGGKGEGGMATTHHKFERVHRDS